MQLHASCVAFDGRAVLIQGQSGAGKSALALQLLAIGGQLVSDDVTLIDTRGGWPVARAPDRLSGVIEARGVGLLRTVPAAAARICLVVDLDRTETDRMPPERYVALAGQELPVFHKVESAHFPAAIRLYLLGGKAAL